MCVCRSISPGNPVYRRRSITSAPRGGASVLTSTIRAPSIRTVAFLMRRLPSHSCANRIARMSADAGAGEDMPTMIARARRDRAFICLTAPGTFLSGRPVTVIFAKVSFEHLDDHVQVGFHRFDVLTELIEPGVRALELLVVALLRRVQMAHDRGQTDDPFHHPVGLRGEPFKICGELRLLTQQKLHGPFDLLRRHWFEFHENPPVSTR